MPLSSKNSTGAWPSRIEFSSSSLICAWRDYNPKWAPKQKSFTCTFSSTFLFLIRTQHQLLISEMRTICKFNSLCFIVTQRHLFSHTVMSQIFRIFSTNKIKTIAYWDMNCFEWTVLPAEPLRASIHVRSFIRYPSIQWSPLVWGVETYSSGFLLFSFFFFFFSSVSEFRYLGRTITKQKLYLRRN